MLSPFFMFTSKIHIILIGCGGTGGCFFSRLARFMADLEIPNLQIAISIIDGDHVESKNLIRQPFLMDDLGSNKAVALARAAEESVLLRVRAYPMYLKPDNVDTLLGHFPFECYSNHDIRIIIGAVDNHACRKLLHKYFLETHFLGKTFYIDSANEISCGEIVIAKKDGNHILAPDRAHYYPDILNDTDKAPYEMSCEELNAAAPQHLATNGLAADLLFSYVSQLIVGHQNVEQAPGGIVYFDAFKLYSQFFPYEEAIHGPIKC